MDNKESHALNSTRVEHPNIKETNIGDDSSPKESTNESKQPQLSANESQAQDSTSRKHDRIIQDANSAETKPNEINFKKKFIPYFQRNKPDWIKYEENQSMDHLKFEMFEVENRNSRNSEISLSNFEIVQAQHSRQLLQSEKERIKTYKIHLEENYIPTFWPPRIWDRDYIRLSCEESNRLSNSIEISRRPPLKPLYFPHPNQLPIWSTKSDRSTHNGEIDKRREENNYSKTDKIVTEIAKKNKLNKEKDMPSSKTVVRADNAHQNSMISSPSLGISALNADTSEEIADVEDI
ncbi:hypothetical protein TVAG_495730 [Trichomonas vaginalis G3]|uniref:Uncharacterized protein n=1 Tax=Trichomonas vaginalis (strain ATCC PRA-98 / G3) TaxID=412133 RepID=A2DVL2_TRIV3|nr:hypothetical protein TVAGG3_0275790 [Trichomonas vaginalis G3]EAY15554.1 hypothetical protein TVAG_495730 [Trichomonas vaginalis G3]KAI5526199.1 hypothetical protein TVAGG3_0275790 [Trichomonas vaginalis G3]|eukprot:XP_001327777.1 hypothetical protein [Trichomonas vaginalis G3]